MIHSGGFGFEHPTEDTELETCVLSEADGPGLDIKKKNRNEEERK